MDHTRFDSWSKVLATKLGSRRGFVQMTAAAAGLGFGRVLLPETEAKKRHRGKHRKHRRKHPPAAQPGPPNRPVDTRIVGGDDVPQGQYPFAAALLDFGYRGTVAERHFCGGTLIGPSHVLTAAHCVDYYQFRPNRLRELKVLVGRARLSDDTVGSFRAVATVDVHPDYGFSFGGNYDVAVLTLASPVSSVTPATLVASGDNTLLTPGTMLKVIGWGDTNPQPGNKPAYPDILQEVEIPVRPDVSCGAEFGGYDPTLMICAGEEGSDSCFGDSGGPLFGIVSGQPRIVGIVNYGRGCGSATPGAYAQLSASPIANFVSDKLQSCGTIDTQTDRNNCGNCGNVCPRATTDRCVAAQCRCGSSPPCTGGTTCNRATGTCV